jgi:CRP-like cAMP-binding protein
MAQAGLLGYVWSMSLKTIIAQLRRHDLFTALDQTRLEVIAFTAERAVFEPGDVLFSAGEEGFDAYLILEGEASMSAMEGFDGERAEEHRVDAGDLIGALALLHEGPRRSTVRAVSRVEVLTISRYLFQRMMQEFPEMAGAVAGALARRLGQTTNEMTELALRLGSVRTHPTD